MANIKELVSLNMANEHKVNEVIKITIKYNNYLKYL